MNHRARMLRVLLFVVVAAGGVGVAGARRRRPPERAGAASDNARPGRARFEMAETKFNLGRFEEAAVDYQAAYEAEPLPAFLFNIGQCYRNLGNYERAQFYFRRYVQLDPRSPNRADAEQSDRGDGQDGGGEPGGWRPADGGVGAVAGRGPTAGGGADDGPVTRSRRPSRARATPAPRRSRCIAGRGSGSAGRWSWRRRSRLASSS